MGQLYIIRLQKGKWYVGYTDNPIKRFLQHAEKKGSKWTKEHHPPIEPCPYWVSEPGHSKEDENRKTLEMMAKHGIRNVRGGDWCMVDMEPYTYKKLEKRVGRPTKGKKCDRCGRDGHTRSQCYATTTADKVAITTKTWKYRPKAKPKPKPKPKPKAKPKPKSKAVTCGRCGHTGHNRTSCFTGTTVDGVKITTKTWKYRPKAKAKRKAKKKRI